MFVYQINSRLFTIAAQRKGKTKKAIELEIEAGKGGMPIENVVHILPVILVLVNLKF